MTIAIIAAEVSFWIVLLGGLSVRYLLRRPRLSNALLRCVPLVDLALVTFVAADVLRGAEPTRGHALAAIYLGVTVAFGHATIAWADARFRHRFAGGPAPVKPSKGSREQVRAVWIEWLRVVTAATIAGVLILILIAIDGFAVPATLDDAAQHPYWGTLCLLGVITGIWFLAGPAFAGRGSQPSSATTPR